MPDHLLQLASTFTGLPGSPGRAVGLACRRQPLAAPVAEGSGDPARRLCDAFAAADARLARAIAGADAAVAPLLEAQRLMLDDPELREGTAALVADGVDPAEAVTRVARGLAEVLEGAGSDYFRERAIDVRAVGTLVAETLAGVEHRVPAGAVVIAEELAPLDTAHLADAGVAALVTVNGGPTCHAAIMARAWGIPAVVGAPAAVLDIPESTPLLVDGTRGRVIVNPSVEECAARVETPAVALARRIPLYANAGSLREVARAREAGAEGIGLLRTEFLVHDRATPPTETEQAALYTEALRLMDGRPVIIRTLDIGADKPVAFLPLPPEPNPQLGVRGIRLCLQQHDLFATQLRALLRAAEHGPLKVLLPMVTTADEVCRTRALLDALAAEMGLPAPPLGAMIEVPMAALAAAEVAAVCDFISLGTNDLLQFLLAADRQHAGVGYLHAADHPAVWPLIAHVIEAAHAAGIPAGVCGEWAADPDKLARLIDLGLDTASVAVGALERVRGYFA